MSNFPRSDHPGACSRPTSHGPFEPKQAAYQTEPGLESSTHCATPLTKQRAKHQGYVPVSVPPLAIRDRLLSAEKRGVMLEFHFPHIFPLRTFRRRTDTERYPRATINDNTRSPVKSGSYPSQDRWLLPHNP